MAKLAMKYQQYDEYKDSGVEWLGRIPHGWKVLRGKYVFQEFRERSITGEEVLLSVSEYYGVKPRSEKISEGDHLSRAESLVDYKKCYKNDLVMNIMLAWKRGLGVSKYDGIVSPAYSVFRFNKGIHPYFMHHLFRTDLYTSHFKTRSTGVIDSRLRLYPESFLDTEILIPSYEEQAQIANFLDHETAQIDTLIEKQKILIQLLKEKRQAVISHAVTKGLNPDAPMKDSGVEWLGEVPEHWIVHSIKYAFQSLNFRRIPLSSEVRGELKGCFRYYGASGVIDYIDDYIFDESTVLVGEDGANLLSRSTPLAFSAHGKYWVNNHAHILRPKDELADYWAEIIENIDVTPIVSGSAQPKLTAEALNNLTIAYPSDFHERSQISDYIKKRKKKYNHLINNAQKAIQLMQERRTALISAAVTGKIDLRDWRASE